MKFFFHQESKVVIVFLYWCLYPYVIPIGCNFTSIDQVRRNRCRNESYIYNVKKEIWINVNKFSRNGIFLFRKKYELMKKEQYFSTNNKGNQKKYHAYYKERILVRQLWLSHIAAINLSDLSPQQLRLICSCNLYCSIIPIYNVVFAVHNCIFTVH